MTTSRGSVEESDAPRVPLSRKELEEGLEKLLEMRWAKSWAASEAAAKKAGPVGTAADVRRNLRKLRAAVRQMQSALADHMLRVGKAYQDVSRACCAIPYESRDYEVFKDPREVIKTSDTLEFLDRKELAAAAVLYNCVIDVHGEITPEIRRRVRRVGWTRAAAITALAAPDDALVNGVLRGLAFVRVEDLSVAELRACVDVLTGREEPRRSRPRRQKPVTTATPA